MAKRPTRRPHREESREENRPEISESREQAIRFLLNVLNATIYSSGEDYQSALEQFFPQLQALGHLVGAESLDEVSAFLRSTCCR